MLACKLAVGLVLIVLLWPLVARLQAIFLHTVRRKKFVPLLVTAVAVIVPYPIPNVIPDMT